MFWLTILGSVLAVAAVAATVALLLFYGLVLLSQVSLELFGFLPSVKFLVIMLKNIRRNLLRTSLTYLAIFTFVAVVTMIWSVVSFLDAVTEERAKDFKAIVTEKYQLPSQMPFSYAASLSEGAPNRPEDYRVPPQDSMTWQFYGGSIDPIKRTRENIVFFFAMDPSRFITMMDGLDELAPEDRHKLEEGLKLMQKNKRGVFIGVERLKAMNKKVGESIKVTSFNYKDIDLEFEILGELPAGRYGQSAVMNRDYLNDALDQYARQRNQKHPLAERTLNLVWVRVPDSDVFRKVGEQIESSSQFSSPAVKYETASSGIASFLDAYRDLIWGMKWILSPVLLVTMALVLANAISISVRERRTEMAVLKVLGFRPLQILVLVLGEALLIGAFSGVLSVGILYLGINVYNKGLPLQIAFFPSFMVSPQALW